MAHARWLIVGLFSFAWMAEARAQVFINPYYPYGGYVVGSGIRFKYRRHRLRISGFIGTPYVVSPFGLGVYGPLYGPVLYGPYVAPYGAVDIRNTVVFQAPPVFVESAARNRLEDETAGIDLDTTDPVTLKPRAEFLKKKKDPEVVERQEPAKKLPKVLRQAEPGMKFPKAAPKVRPAPRPLREKLDEEMADPLDLGKKAFAAREYGQAAQRFRQAALAAPLDCMPHFLLAQAQFALGKYRDAVNAIQAGLALKKDWPGKNFSPRALYKGNQAEFPSHLKRLEQLVDKHPNDGVMLFLLAYELWFDGQRAKARPLFRQAQQFAPDPAWCDPFLKGGI
jgi:hypothetical protein